VTFYEDDKNGVPVAILGNSIVHLLFIYF